VQEALSNVRKHARATEVWVDVDKGPPWRFTVRDNGRGFEPQPPGPDDTHVGLHIMRERAERIGARVRVHSVPEEGTEVMLELQG
jgi:two-component system nitrate/nitrite sensor histidine kinase NarX